MQVHFTPELEAKLARTAAEQGREPEQLVQQAVARYFDEDICFIDAVNRGEDALKRGTSHMTKWASASIVSCGPDAWPTPYCAGGPCVTASS
jgi:predicted transcriptional regulator